VNKGVADESKEPVNVPVEALNASICRKEEPPLIIAVIVPLPPKQAISADLKGVPDVEIVVPFGILFVDTGADIAPKASCTLMV
jgi:hypothetical protein